MFGDAGKSLRTMLEIARKMFGKSQKSYKCVQKCILFHFLLAGALRNLRFDILHCLPVHTSKKFFKENPKSKMQSVTVKEPVFLNIN